MAVPMLHLFTVVLNCYAIWYDQNYVDVMYIKELQQYPFNGRALFLTIWCLILQTIYFTVAFINDIFGTNERSPLKSPVIRKIKDALFSAAYPLSIYVSVAFWSIYFWDRELIFPEHVRKVFPTWLNHTMHTLVSVMMNIEMITSYKTYPSRIVGCSLISMIVLPYVLSLFIIYGNTGLWVYPVLGHLNWAGRIFFISSSACVAYILYFIGEKINNTLHPSPMELKNNKVEYKNGKTR